MNGRVEVWRVALDGAVAGADALSPDERDRAARFHFERDRRRYVASHAALRAILSRHTGRPAAALRFSTGPRGKPALDGGPPFNLSHSGERALVAIGETELGVDIEVIAPDIDYQQVAQSFFSPRERAALDGIAPAGRAAAFFRGWTNKEAYIKARGDGFHLPLDSFDVALAPGEPARLYGTRPDARDAARFMLADLTTDPGYAAALCVDGRIDPERVIYYSYDG